MAIATNREYLQASLSKFNLTESDIDLIMVEHPELEGVLNVRVCKLALHRSFSAIIPVADVKEGGYSITWNMDGIKVFYNGLCEELGLPNVTTPKIRNRSNYW